MSAFAHSSLDRGGLNGVAGRDALKVAFIVGMCYFVNDQNAFSTTITPCPNGASCRHKVPLLPPSGPAIGSLLRNAASGVYLFDLRRLIAHPTGDLRREPIFLPAIP